MVYKDFEALNNSYENDRNDMGFEEELMYVEDCFDTYEATGFAETFESPYEENKAYEGLKFSVDGRLSYSAGEADLECLPMWHITFENGVKIDAFPEEICVAERNA